MTLKDAGTGGEEQTKYLRASHVQLKISRLRAPIKIPPMRKRPAMARQGHAVETSYTSMFSVTGERISNELCSL